MSEIPEPKDADKGFWPDWLTPRRVFDFARNVIALERSVASIQEENRDLRLQMTRLQQQVSSQNASIELLTRFVEGAIEARVETTTARFLRDMLSGDKPRNP